VATAGSDATALELWYDPWSHRWFAWRCSVTREGRRKERSRSLASPDEVRSWLGDGPLSRDLYRAAGW
jgi:hypothetical protein